MIQEKSLQVQRVKMLIQELTTAKKRFLRKMLITIIQPVRVIRRAMESGGRINSLHKSRKDRLPTAARDFYVTYWLNQGRRHRRRRRRWPLGVKLSVHTVRKTRSSVTDSVQVSLLFYRDRYLYFRKANERAYTKQASRVRRSRELRKMPQR